MDTVEPRILPGEDPAYNHITPPHTPPTFRPSNSTKMMLKTDPALSTTNDHEAVHTRNGSTYETPNGGKMLIASELQAGEKQVNESERNGVKDENCQPQVENRGARERNERMGSREMVD